MVAFKDHICHVCGKKTLDCKCGCVVGRGITPPNWFKEHSMVNQKTGSVPLEVGKQYLLRHKLWDGGRESINKFKCIDETKACYKIQFIDVDYYIEKAKVRDYFIEELEE